MKISLNWLRDYIDFDESAEEIAEILTFLNFEAEGIETIRRHVEGVKVGKILESKPHPNADKLKLTKVDIGTGNELSIVCGALNCREGLIVPVAPVGTKIGDITIDARKIRGEASEGMILSEAELGITEDHSGVLELTDDFKVGDDFSEVVPTEDTVIEFEVTVNRPDALSHIGIARELSAYWKRPLKMPSFDVVEESDRRVQDEVKIDINAPKQGPRYVARKVTGVKVKPSPLWMKARLFSIGQRPISNVVDITNYVLFELGHPLHAFDADMVKDGHIIVRLAEDGETFVTLDDKERKLTSQDLMIADPEKGIALAGVMGGANSEISDATEDVILEAAYFDPPTVRRTAKSQALFSEASRRFERGADPEMAPRAAARAAELFRRYAGAQVVRGLVDAYPNPIEPEPITYRPERAEVILGFDVSKEDAAHIFTSLECEVQAPGEVLVVTPPTFRPDLEREIDLIEEAARHVGYDKVPVAFESRVVLASEDPPLERIVDTAVDTMVALGFRETVGSAMVAGNDQKTFFDLLEPLRIHRPINPEMNVYRASLVPGLLRTLEYNVNRGIENVLICEVAQVGGKGWFGISGDQRMHLSFAMTGHLRPPAYDRPEKPVDLQDVKAVIHTIARGLTLDKPVRFSYDTPANLLYGVVLDGNDGVEAQAGIAGVVREEVAEKFGIGQPVYVGEIDLERWLNPEEGGIRRPGIAGTYTSFSRFPSNVRDIAFVVPKSVTAERIEGAIRDHADSLLEDVELFDLYEGEPLGQGERSLAYRLIFRAPDRTLTDDDVDPFVNKIVQGVKTIEGVRLRG